MSSPTLPSPPRFLIGEPDPVNRSFLALLARQLGVEAKTASLASGLIEAFDTTSPNLVILNCALPSGGAFEVSRYIREKEKAGSPRVPILGLSSDHGDDVEQTCMAAGMDACVFLPLTAKQMRAKILELMPS